MKLDGRSFTIENAIGVLRGDRITLSLTPDSKRAMDASHKLVEEKLASDEGMYGINTGFGKLSKIRVGANDLAALQKNLLLSHAAGTGTPIEPPVARLALYLRANALAHGHSGVRSQTIRLLMDLCSAGVAPVMPSQGSVGASGDLAPLAHMALLLIGKGEGWLGGKRLSGRKILEKIRRKPLQLHAKEGLALINGTQVSTAQAVAGLIHTTSLARTADLACATSLEALRGSIRAFDNRIHKLRGHPGQMLVARNVRRLLKGSRVIPSHADCDRVQDPYSLRCAPQVHGAVRDTIAHARGVLEREMNAVTDNPILFPDRGDVLSGGNFHAEPVAMVADFLAIAAAELASISERRIETMVNPDLSGLPAFLSPDPGLNSGFMIAQVTAAALVSENKTLCHPASVDSIPTSAGKEDHVSMATWAARKLSTIAENVEKVLAIEVLCGSQGLDLHPEWIEPGVGVSASHRLLRKSVRKLGRDRELAPDIEKARKLIRSEALLKAAEKASGKLE